MKPSKLAVALRTVALTGWALICLWPIYWVVISSIKPPIEFIGPSHYVPFVDFTPSLGAWREVLFELGGEVPLRFLNTVIVSVGSTAIAVLIGSMAAYPMSRSPLRRYKPHRIQAGLGAVVATRILPPVLLVLPLYYIGQKTGLLDTRLLLVLVYATVNLPIAAWLMYGFFNEIPVELDEAAQLDGASRYRVFFELIVPLSWAALGATFLLILFLSWNEYFISVYLTADRAMTMAPYLASQMTTREQMAAADPDDYGRLAVVLVMMLLPLLVFAGLFQRVIARFARDAV